MRPNTVVENYVLVSKNYNEETIMGDFSHYMIGGIINNNISKHWNPTEHKCITLDALLKKHNVTNVDFFALDVEGYEKEVLEGINFDDVFFHLLVIESHDFHGFKDASNDFSFLENFGFENIKNINQHKFYINKKSEFYPKVINNLWQ